MAMPTNRARGPVSVSPRHCAKRTGPGRLGLVCGAVMLALLAGCSKVEEARQAVSAPASSAAGELHVQAETFRVLGTIGLLRGLQAYGTPEANLRMKALGGQFFTTPGWETSWQLFLSTALTNVVRAEGESPLVGYYHPYSDTMLLTGWKKQPDGRWRIVSADVLPGAVVRGAPPPWSLARSWKGLDLYPPEALAQVTTATTSAFAQGFAASGDPLARVPANAREGLAAMAAVPFEDFRSEVAPLYAGGSDTAGILRLWGEVREAAITGKSAYTGDIAEAIAALSKLNVKVRDSATPVAYVATDKAEVLMLASQLEPGLVIVLKANRTPTGAQLVRLDLLSFRRFAEAATKGGTQ